MKSPQGEMEISSFYGWLGPLVLLAAMLTLNSEIEVRTF